jgi:hypothetical protein
VPGDDLIVVADQHRIGEAEPLNAVGDLADLLPGVRAGVLRKRPQARYGHQFKIPRTPRQGVIAAPRPHHASNSPQSLA